jgi:hypothetical protein
MLGARAAAPVVGSHPAVTARRTRDITLVAVTGLVALGLAFVVALAVPHPNLVKGTAVVVAMAVILGLIVSPRAEVTVTVVVLYLGLLDGPVKLLTASKAASTVRNALVLAVVIGMAARLFTDKKRISIPPLGAWVLAFVASVLIQALNPATHGTLKILAGYRQELEWIPFFFFGYAIIRSKQRLRKMFLILGVIALANGVVSVYQSRLSPNQLASWGPGYATKVKGTPAENGKKAVGGRTYNVEGEARNRPPGLASDAGGGGGLGVLALPGLLALLSVGGLRRKWVVPLCVTGAMLGIASAGSRSSVVIAAVALLSYVVLSFVSRLRISRLLAALLVGAVLTVGAGEYLLAESGPNVFKRQESLTSVSSAESTGGSAKVHHLEALPRIVGGAPLGSGLGTTAAAGAFGGKQKVTIEGRGVGSDANLNLLGIELGAPGLFLWIGLTLNVIWLAFTRIRNIADLELRTYLVAVFASYFAHIASGFGGPTLASVGGVFLWLAPGLAAYWLVGPGYAAYRRRKRRYVAPTTLAPAEAIAVSA